MDKGPVSAHASRFYMALMCMCRKPGWSAWILFPMFILGAFQLVLLYLFGRSIIASDMFLNLFTTNSGEVGELLGKLMPAIIGVCVLYIPTLAIGVYSARLKEELPASFRLKTLRSAAIVFALSLPFCLSGKFRITDDIFPANIFYNMASPLKAGKKASNTLKHRPDLRFRPYPNAPTPCAKYMSW